MKHRENFTIKFNVIKLHHRLRLRSTITKKNREILSSSNSSYQELHVNNLESVETTNRSSSKNGQFPTAVTLLPSP